MKKFKQFDITIEVDEELLKKEYPGMELEDAVLAALNWLHDEGIYVDKLKQVK